MAFFVVFLCIASFCAFADPGNDNTVRIQGADLPAGSSGLEPALQVTPASTTIGTTQVTPVTQQNVTPAITTVPSADVTTTPTTGPPTTPTSNLLLTSIPTAEVTTTSTVPATSATTAGPTTGSTTSVTSTPTIQPTAEPTPTPRPSATSTGSVTPSQTTTQTTQTTVTSTAPTSSATIPPTTSTTSGVQIVAAPLSGEQSKAPQSSPSAHGPSDMYSPDEVIVRFKPQPMADAGNKGKTIAKAHTAVSATVVDDYDKKGLSGMQVVKLEPGQNVEDAITEYESNPDVLYAVPNYKINLYILFCSSISF